MEVLEVLDLRRSCPVFSGVIIFRFLHPTILDCIVSNTIREGGLGYY